ncbi:MAG: LLM class flavin-dependent oxidoreductase [Thaumarchaeota archaeon]|jgi:alkanesulfonate monooxygenase|nr:LLM class flavin-dependent oxidoreductase [Nitrososphaerota archaeon]
MKLGIALDNFTVPGSAVNVKSLVEKAKLADSLGFESIWLWDHLLLGSKTVYPVLEPIALISNIAAHTDKIKLGTLYLFGLRDPLVLSKLISTVSYLSNDRLMLGAVAGWYKKEFDVVGVDFGNRGKTLSERITLVRSLLYSQDINVKNYSHITIEPRPSKKVPILIGGYLENSLKRAARMGDGWISYYFKPDDFKWGLGVMEKYNKNAPALDNTDMVPVYVGDNGEERVRKFTDEFMDLPSWSRCNVSSGIWGTPGEVIQKIIEYSEAGVKRLVFIPAYYEKEQIEILGQKVLSKIQ